VEWGAIKRQTQDCCEANTKNFGASKKKQLHIKGELNANNLNETVTVAKKIIQ